MTMPEVNFECAVAPRDALADVLRGSKPAHVQPMLQNLRLGDREVCVFWKVGQHRPCILCVADNDRQELFNWAVTFHPDLSPLTSWCHVISQREFERIGSSGRANSDLLGLEAAWAGASIAEAMVLSRRGFDTISLPACLATECFAIARTAALYGGRGALSHTIERLDEVRDRFRRGQLRWRPTTSLAVAALLRLLPDAPPPSTRILDLLARACWSLQAQEGREDVPYLERNVLREMALQIRKLENLESLQDVSAEERVKLLREIRTWASSTQNEEDRNLLFFSAGYVISRIGGAERDLRLAESFEDGYPSVLIWAIILGGLGAKTYWADAFGGIGRLVARELSRTLDLSEPPYADISSDELSVIGAYDRGVQRFRTAQRGFASISLRPGVVVQIGIGEEDRLSRSEGAVRAATARSSNIGEGPREKQLQELAEQLFPYMRTLFLRSGMGQGSPAREKRSGKGKTPELPLRDK